MMMNKLSFYLLNTYLNLFLISFSLTFISYGQESNTKSIKVFGGTISPDGWDMGYHLGLGFSIAVDSSQIFCLGSSISYWLSNRDEEYLDANYNFQSETLKLSNLSIAIDILFYPIKSKAELYIGGGVSYNWIEKKYFDVHYLPFEKYPVENKSQKVGLNLLSGLLINFDNLSGLIEAKYNLIPYLITYQFSLGIVYKI